MLPALRGTEKDRRPGEILAEIEALVADPEAIPQVHIRADVNTPWRCVAGAIYNVQAAGYPTVGFISNPVDPNG